MPEEIDIDLGDEEEAVLDEEMTADEAAAALAMITRMSEDLMFPEAPQSAETAPEQEETPGEVAEPETEEVSEEGEELTEEPEVEEEPDTRFEDLEENVNKRFDELETKIEDGHKAGNKELAKIIKNALK